MRKKIALINLYGSNNIGDEAIQAGAFELLNNIGKKQNHVFSITVHCENPRIFPTYHFSNLEIRAKSSPYGFILRTYARYPIVIYKIVLFFFVICVSIVLACVGKLNSSLLPKKGFFSYIYDLLSADIVMGIGGGYFVSKNAMRDFFGLGLTLLPLEIAQMFRKKIFHFPVSIGPFATKVHADLTFRVLSGSTLFTRDPISNAAVSKVAKQRSISFDEFADTATRLRAPKSSKYWVLTVRDWLPPKQQKNYELTLAKLIDSIWEDHSTSVCMLVMAQNIIEDNDRNIFSRIQALLQHPESCFTAVPMRHQQAQAILHNAEFSICTRMHAAILSLTVGTPFLTIGYGLKGKGFMESINLSKWFIDISKVESSQFTNLVTRFVENLRKIKVDLQKSKHMLDKKMPSLQAAVERELI